MGVSFFDADVVDVRLAVWSAAGVSIDAFAAAPALAPPVFWHFAQPAGDLIITYPPRGGFRAMAHIEKGGRAELVHN